MNHAVETRARDIRQSGRAPSSHGGAALASLSAAQRRRTEIGQLLRRPPVQAKVAIGPAGDRFEREADAVAARVVAGERAPPISRIPAAGLEPAQRQADDEEEVQAKLLQRQAAEEEEEEPVQAKPIQRQAAEEEEEPVQATPIQRQAAEEEEEPVQTKLIQRQAAEEEEEPVQTKLIQRQAEEEEEPVQAKLLQRQAAEEEEEPVQTKLLQRQAGVEEEEEPVQAKSGGGQSSSMASAAQRAIDTKGAGQPLAPQTRSTLESQMGADLSQIRVHDDSAAQGAAKSLGARAFTHGSDIWLGRGESQRDTSLMAHEATHVVQQGGAVRRLLVQRQNPPVATTGGGGGAGTATAVTTPPPIPAEAGTVNEAQGNIDYPTLKLADFKAQGHRGTKYSAQTIKRAKNFARGSPDQATVWDNSIPDRVVEDKLKDKLASTLNPSDPGRTYVLKHAESRYYLIGTLRQMVRASKRPIWDPGGNPRPKDVDHIVELQISGWPDAAWANQAGASGNMELLDSQANQDSGRKIMREVGRLVKLTREHYWRRPSDPAGPVPGTDADFWVRSRQPSLKSIKQRYDLTFNSIAPGLGQAGQPENHWQWKEIAEDTKHLDNFAPDTDGFDSGSWTIFPDAAGGVPKQLPHTSGADEAPRERDVRGWFNPFEVRRIKLADPGTLAADTGTEVGTITLGLPSGSGRTPYGFRLSDPIPLRRFPGLPNGAYLDAGGLSAVWRALTIRGLSPVEIQSWTVQPGTGILARGTLLPSIPIFADLGIELIIDGDELRLSKVFDIGEFNLPGPIEVSDSSLEVFAGTRGIGARGEVGLVIENVGEGRIEGRVDTEGGFALNGAFTFDPQLFDPPSQIQMGYANGEFSGSGTLTIGDNRVRGIKTASITVSYAQGVLTATGTAELDVPGLEQGTMTLTYSEEEGFAIGGTFNLSPDVPGIRSGSVTATVRERPEGEEGYMVSASGTAEPDIPGIDSQVTVSYEDGIFTAEAAAQYSRGMLSGSLSFGVTNRPVDEQGNPGEGPTPELRAFGGGSVTVQLTPWLEGTAGIRLLPNGEVEITGEIGLPDVVEIFPEQSYERNLFTINLDIPIFGVAVAGQRIGIFATIGGGLDLSAGIGPGQLTEARLGVTYNPDHEDQTHIEGGAQFVVPAHAGVRLFVRGALGAGIPIVSATLGLEIGGELGLAGALEAAVTVDWTPAQGLVLDAYGEIYVQPKFRFDLTGFALVEADLFFTSIELYSQRWELAAFEFGPDLRLGIKLPIHYEEGQPFDVDWNDVEFDVPDIEPMEILDGLIDRIA